MMCQEALGRLVKVARISQGLTYKDLEALGFNMLFWRAVETGQKMPTPVEFKKMVEALERGEQFTQKRYFFSDSAESAGTAPERARP